MRTDWQRKYRELKAAVDDHNEDCRDNCGRFNKLLKQHCAPYTERGRWCVDCPMHGEVEVPE